jgi:hypothetical protein
MGGRSKSHRAGCGPARSLSGEAAAPAAQGPPAGNPRAKEAQSAAWNRGGPVVDVDQRADPGEGRADADELGGHKVAFAAVVAADGEQLGPIAFCQACGAYFWHRVGGLSRPCRGARPYGQLALIKNGRFPATQGRYRSWKVEKIALGRQTQLWQLRQQLSACSEGGGPSAPARHRLTCKTGPAASAIATATCRLALLGRYGLTESDLAAAVREARPRTRREASPDLEAVSDDESVEWPPGGRRRNAVLR